MFLLFMVKMRFLSKRNEDTEKEDGMEGWMFYASYNKDAGKAGLWAVLQGADFTNRV